MKRFANRTYTEEEAIGFFDQALQEVRQERREGKTQGQF